MAAAQSLSSLAKNILCGEGTVEIAEFGLQGLLPKGRWSRRGFVMTSLASGFALSVQPIAAQTVITTAEARRAG